MKKSNIFIIILFLTVEILPHWVQTNGPYGGGVYCLAEYENNIFAGTAWGIYFSTDNGTSWARIYSGSTIFLSSMVVIPNETGKMCVFGGYRAFRQGLFRLTGNEKTWEVDSLILDERIFDLCISGTNIYAGTCRGVLVSRDYGNSWTETNNGLPHNTCVKTLFAIPNRAGGTNLFAIPEGKGIFLSTDNGTTWSLVNSGLSSEVSCFAAIDTNLFAGTYGSGVLRSTNDGITWSPANNSLTNMTVRSLVVIDENLFAQGSSGYYIDSIYLSTNNGESWNRVQPGLPLIDPMVFCLIASGENLFAGSSSGIFLSTNSGSSWTLINYGLSSSSINCFAVSGNNLFTGTEGNGVFLSTNNGSSWSPINTGLKDNYIRALIINGTNLFAGTANGVFLYKNGGTSWTEVNTGLTNIWIRSFANMEETLFVGTEGGGVFRSENNGITWTAASMGLTNKTVYSLAVMDSHLFAGTWGGGIFVSDNYGSSWTSCNSGLQTHYIESFAIVDSNIFASTSSGVFISSNKGAKWIKADLPFFSFVQMVKIEGYIFVGNGGMGAFSGEGVYVSTDNGLSWSAVNSGLTGAPINALAVCDTELFAGTAGNGVWHRPLAEMITNVKSSTELPKEFTIYQNYPNPFNPSTTIKYSIPKPSNVTLKVYDVLGSEIEALVQKIQTQGSYEVEFDGSELTSGIYFYRLRAGDYVETKKMIVLK